MTYPTSGIDLTRSVADATNDGNGFLPGVGIYLLNCPSFNAFTCGRTVLDKS